MLCVSPWLQIGCTSRVIWSLCVHMLCVLPWLHIRCKVEKSGVCVHNAVYVAMATDQLYQWNDLEFVCTQ